MLQPGVLFSLAALQAPSSLTTEQSAMVFHLGAKCQAVGTQLAKEFQQLSGVEAMHHAMAQATAHKTINRGHMERGVAYSVLMSANSPNKKHEKTLWKLCREADQAWKDTNNVVFKHQLRCNSHLASFITLHQGDTPGEVRQGLGVHAESCGQGRDASGNLP